MDIVIRHGEPKDMPDLASIFSEPEAVQNSGQLPFRGMAFWEELLTPNNLFIQLVAEHNQQVIGHLGINLSDNPRRNHCANFGIMIHPDHQGKGVGRLLMEKMIDLADNWLNLVRIELDVFTDNKRAVHLYKSMGFEIEGESKFDAFKNGRYANSYRMARIRPDYH